MQNEKPLQDNKHFYMSLGLNPPFFEKETEQSKQNTYRRNNIEYITKTSKKHIG